MDNGLKNADDLLRGIFSHMGNVGSNDIIRQHGGSIQVETGPGEFTEMIIQLPSQPVMSVDVEGGTQAATVSDSS